MPEEREQIVPIFIEEEMKHSYIDYSMSVIVSRALPDVRDGFKPVHRKVLFGMLELGLRPGSLYKKSARIVGEVLGKYHPHGDMAVYDTMVRMVQDFTLRYPLVDGQGNFGSVDGDAPAAMRYTEARFAAIAEQVIMDLDKNTVNFVPNFDGTLTEPTILPTVLPNLMVNGSAGIAVGMATNIPPHNLSEVVNGLVALIEDPKLKPRDFIKYIKGPDFPTGAIILGDEGIEEYFISGRGHLTVRARAFIEEIAGGRQSIVVTEIPYQVNKAALIERIAGLANEKKIDGITEARDESDREGMRIVFELRRDCNAEKILNQLYKHSQMQSTFGVIMLALVEGRPRVLNIKEVLQAFLDFRHDVIFRRTQFELDKAEKRAHILEGLKIALDNIDEIIDLIKRSRTPETAKASLIKRFKLSEIQAQAILDMRLQRLTGLEQKKIQEEYLELIKRIEDLKSILASKGRRMQIVKQELLELKEKYGDERRTTIVSDKQDFSLDDMKNEDQMVVTITNEGAIQRYASSTFQFKSGSGDVKGEYLKCAMIASPSDFVLVFSNQGNCYWIRVRDIPVAGLATTARLDKLLYFSKNDLFVTAVPVKSFTEKGFVALATVQGVVKRLALAELATPKKGGVMVMKIAEGDHLVSAITTTGEQELMLGTTQGKAIRFKESDVRDMGKSASGVRGMELEGDDRVVGMIALSKKEDLLSGTANGFTKKTKLAEYRETKRGGKGILNYKITDQVGPIVGLLNVGAADEILLTTLKGKVLKKSVKTIKQMGRATKGEQVLKLTRDDIVVTMILVPK